MKLATNIARDAHAGGSGAGIRHGSGDVRCPVVECGDRGGGPRTARAVSIAQAKIVDEAGERHGAIADGCRTGRFSSEAGSIEGIEIIMEGERWRLFTESNR